MSSSRSAASASTQSNTNGPSAHRLLFWVYTVIALAYVIWRGTATLSIEHPYFGLVFYAAELVCLASSLVFYAILSSPTRVDEAQPAREGTSVDVFITTYNEEPDLVRSTALAARDMDFPHNTWICDDGRRAEMRELAKELGVGYLTRSKNTHFKAGNLNHAMSKTSGEFVVVLDADHVPASTFLSSLLGYFEADPKLALVQIPQVYYNVDSYQHALPNKRERLWHEASLFHHRMQPGADARGAAFFVGTGAILRRSALDAVGGFATGSITEDIHTSIRLHAAGFRSRYVDRPLGYLLAPDTPLAYACQRLRWTQGAMQIIRSEPLLWRKGLKPWQRISYFNSLFGYLAAYQHLVFYLAPGIFLYTGVSPINVDPKTGFPIFVAYILFSLALYKTVAAPQAKLFLGECYKILNLAVHIRGSFALLWPQGLSFRVTPKGAHRGVPLFLILPALFITLFNVTAVGAGITQMTRGTLPVGSLILATLFSGFFSVAGALTLLHTLERRGHSEAFAFPVKLSCPILNREGWAPAPAQLWRLNHRIAYLETDCELDDTDVHALDLQAVGLERPIRATVIGRQRTADFGTSRQILKLALESLTNAERDTIDRYIFNKALPDFFESFEANPPLSREPDTATGEAPLTHSDRRFLPVRSAIV